MSVPASAPAKPAVRRTRRARLVVTYLDPWTVLKISTVLALCLAVVMIIASLVLTAILTAFGVFSAINDAGSSILGANFSVSPGLFVVLSAAIAVVDAILMAALATVGAMLYNLSVRLVGGGIEAVLTDAD